MRTFSGRPHNINESILSSVNAGKKHYIEEFVEWCKEHWIRLDDPNKFQIDYNTGEITGAEDAKQPFTLDQYPSNIKFITLGKINTVNLIQCEFEEFTLPKESEYVFISRCDKLKTLKVQEGSSIKTLCIEGCANLDLANSDFSGLELEKLTIKECPNLTGLKNVSTSVKKLISIEDCESYNTFDIAVDSKYAKTLVINIRKCKLKSFSTKLSGKRVKLEDCKTGRSASIQLGKLSELTIDNLRKCTSLSISGNVEQCDIIDCDIETLEAPNCTFALSLIDLLSLKTINAQNNRIKGRIVVSSNDTMEVVKQSGIKCNKVALG